MITHHVKRLLCTIAMGTIVSSVIVGCGNPPAPTSDAAPSTPPPIPPSATPAPPTETAAPPTATPVPTPHPSLTPTRDRAASYEMPGDFVDEITIDRQGVGAQKCQFKVHIPPSYRPDDAPVPLVLNFHGGSMTMEDHEAMSGMSAKSNQAGFIVVYPQAFVGGNYVWCDSLSGCESGVQFIRSLIEHLQDHLNIDPNQIYATGLSSGGGFAYLLGCKLADELAAVAAVAGAYEDRMATCEAERPVPVLIVHGQQDLSILYEGGDGRMSVPDWAAEWARRNDCDQDPTVTAQQEDVTRATWENCAADATVMLYTIRYGDHDWFRYPISATDVVWEFFDTHPAPEQSE